MRATTIPGVLAAAAGGPHAAAVAILEPAGWTMSYAELERRALALAGALLDAGVAPGDHVALWGPNGTEWVVAQQAVLAIGARVVPLNTRYTIHEATDIVERARCRVVFVADPSLEACRAAWPDRLLIPFAGRAGGGWNPTWTAMFDRGAALLDQVLARRDALSPDDVSHIQFTSGTTGKPKGAMLRHRAAVTTSRLWVEATGLGPGDRYPVVAPFAHLGGHKTGLLTCCLVGATVIPIAALRTDELAELIGRLGVTFMQGPPTLFHDIVARHRRQPGIFAGVRVCVTGAAVVPPTLVRSLREEIEVEQVHTAYGLTESTGVVTITAASDDIEQIATTVGYPLPCLRVRVVDDTGADVAGGTPGEVIVAGDSVMAGYLDDPAATAAAVVDGWLHTGDIGVLGADGSLRIVDRMTEMIAVGGLNVYPAEVEHELLEHPALSAVAVVGTTDERLGEIPVAFMVPRDPDADVAALVADVTAWAAARLARFKIPRRFHVVAQLPVNAAGKVAKSELRAASR